MAKVTVHIPDELLPGIKEFTERSGGNLSALVVRGLRQQMVAEAARSHHQLLANRPGLAELMEQRRQEAARAVQGAV